ncbi:hypothetical protein KFK09_016048 [Dendrobium nobile]|uniref:Uncharacterized protein n=1 Tax=Dendrobium nobile TaxID=94219 RepID=A0A8T3B7N8_DENNO|nr:hypothetical protein KFK09_016048 [Dendrobium nobile]
MKICCKSHISKANGSSDIDNCSIAGAIVVMAIADEGRSGRLRSLVEQFHEPLMSWQWLKREEETVNEEANGGLWSEGESTVAVCLGIRFLTKTLHSYVVLHHLVSEHVDNDVEFFEVDDDTAVNQYIQKIDTSPTCMWQLHACINAVSSSMVSKLGLSAAPHPNPYKVAWVNTTALEVKERSFIPISFADYKENVWCDMLIMNVGQILLGCPWLFDNDVHIYGRSNICVFEHEGKKIKLLPSQPWVTDNPESNPVKAKKGLNLIVAIAQSVPLHTLVDRETLAEFDESVPQESQPIPGRLVEIHPDDLPDPLPPIRGISYVLDLAPRASLSDRFPVGLDYHDSVTRTLGLSPSKIVYGFKPRPPLDLMPMYSRYKIFESASSFASHLHELHKEIAQQIERNNNEYKLHADLKRRFKTFEVGDSVMVRIRPE